MSELQDLVHSLAMRLGRAVAIDDERLHLGLFSSHVQVVDGDRLAGRAPRPSPPY
jgi:hypothetical protein